MFILEVYTDRCRNIVKKILLEVLALLSVTVVGVGVFAYTIYQQGGQKLAKTHIKKSAKKPRLLKRLNL